MRLRHAITALTAGCLLVAGCADGPAPDAGVAAEPAATERGGREQRARVVIDDFEYAPGRLVVARGTQVRWVNRDAANHTVTFKASRPGDLGNISEGGRLATRFDRAGRYRYVCVYHPSMRGLVVVR